MLSTRHWHQIDMVILSYIDKTGSYHNSIGNNSLPDSLLLIKFFDSISKIRKQYKGSLQESMFGSFREKKSLLIRTLAAAKR